MHYVLDDRTFVPTNGFRERLAKSLMRRYGLALFFVAVALATTLLLQHLFPYPFLFLFFAAVMTSVITFSLLKGLLAGIATGYVSQRVHSMLLGILAGIGIAAALSLLVILRAGMTLFWDILLPGMLLGAVVGFATQRFGRTGGSALAVR